MSTSLVSTKGTDEQTKRDQLEKAKDKRLKGLRDWQKDTFIFKHTCKRCEKSWKSRVEHPMKCRSCGDPHWSEEYMRAPAVISHKKNPVSYSAIAIEKEDYNGLKMMSIKEGKKLAPFVAEKLREIGIPRVKDEDFDIFLKKLRQQGKIR